MRNSTQSPKLSLTEPSTPWGSSLFFCFQKLFMQDQATSMSMMIDDGGGTVVVDVDRACFAKAGVPNVSTVISVICQEACHIIC